MERTDWPDARLNDLKENVQALRNESTEQHRQLGLKVDKVAEKVDERIDSVVESIATDKNTRAANVRQYFLGAGVPVLGILLATLAKLAFG